ncbi:MAG TPA: biotin/lipoyl-binding protein, partial [Flavitalea sp.]|nr:biotin/lipoyl-binding protein [Flavitalea sp.]
MKKSNIISLLVITLEIISCRDKNKNVSDASGSFEAIETIISAEANGKILQLNIEEGQQVDSGQIIGYLDSSQLHLNKGLLLQNKKAILSGRPEASVQLESLRAELANAELDRSRIDKLVNGGVASQKQLDDATAKISTLQARIKAQESSLHVSTSSINEQGSSIDEQMKELNDKLKKYVIINNVKGTVLTKYAEPYEMAVIGRPLYKVADLSTIILRAYITG